MVGISEKIGIGIYTPIEAARYVGVSVPSLRRWFYGAGRGARVVASDFDQDKQILSFANLIEALAIKHLRKGLIDGKRIPLQSIRKAVEYAEAAYNLENILARRHTVYAFDGKLWISHDGEFHGISPGQQEQILNNKLAQPFMHAIEFNENDEAALWRPLKRGGLSVVLDPRRRFGKPIIEPHGYTAETLVQAIKSEGSVEAASDAYEISPAAFRFARKYISGLDQEAA